MPRLPIQRVSLLFLLSERAYEDDSGKALDVLHSDYTEAFAEYKWNNFYQLFQKLVSEKLAESASEPRKVYLIEITELGEYPIKGYNGREYRFATRHEAELHAAGLAFHYRREYRVVEA